MQRPDRESILRHLESTNQGWTTTYRAIICHEAIMENPSNFSMKKRGSGPWYGVMRYESPRPSPKLAFRRSPGNNLTPLMARESQLYIDIVAVARVRRGCKTWFGTPSVQKSWSFLNLFDFRSFFVIHAPESPFSKSTKVRPYCVHSENHRSRPLNKREYGLSGGVQ